MESDPFVTFSEIYSNARNAERDLYNAAALATVGADGRPSVRMVLVKDAGERGFVFYTNLNSRKGRDLATRSRAALCFWWRTLATQIRVEGRVERVSDAEADEYFASRPRDGQIGAWASKQSDMLPSREELLQAAEEASRRFENAAVPRPAHWSGFRLLPESIEFWFDRPGRLHERHLFSKVQDRWERTLLYP
jgi:pyridoxamine 5'-phosphate oxidase